MSRKSGILVYDIGTTRVKTAVFETSGALLCSLSAPYKTEYPKPGWAEQDPDQFWEAAVKGAREMLASPQAADVAIEVIGLSGHMNGCLPVDARGNPTYPELIHSDSRSGVQWERLLSMFGADRIYSETGSPADVHFSLPKMLWLKDEREDAFKKTAWFLNSKDYLRFKLTGNPGLTDFSDASLTDVFDVNKRQWAWDFIDALGLSRERFPNVMSSVEKAGVLSEGAARILGLPSGIPVSAGGGDGACATRGSGVRAKGEAYISLGSSAFESMLSPVPVFDAGRRNQNFFDLDGVSCNVCGTVQCAGSAVDWVLGLLFGDAPLGPEQYRSIEEGLEGIPPGADGVIFLPYLMGERSPHWNPNARGVFAGLSLASGRKAMLRSVYEGVAFALREITGIYDDLAMPISSLTLLGGGIRSSFWRNIICDVLGMPMTIHPFPTHAIALGAAMAAGVSAGIWPSLDAAADHINFSGEKILPDGEKTRRYEKYYPVYQNLYRGLKKSFDELGTIQAAR
jgi:xylulokinase